MSGVPIHCSSSGVVNTPSRDSTTPDASAGGHGGVDGAAHGIHVSCAVVAGDDNARADADAHEQADEQLNQ